MGDQARLYAESPPPASCSTGRLHRLRFPDEVRVDSGVEGNARSSAYYDPMIAKLINHGATRRRRHGDWLSRRQASRVWPVRTNAAFLARTIGHPEFQAGAVDTGFIERLARMFHSIAEPGARVLRAAAQAILPKPGGDVWATATGSE